MNYKVGDLLIYKNEHKRIFTGIIIECKNGKYGSKGVQIYWSTDGRKYSNGFLALHNLEYAIKTKLYKYQAINE